MIPAKVKAEAIAFAKRGIPHREVARRMTAKYKISVSPSAVRVWLRADGVPAQAQPDQHPTPVTKAKPRKRGQARVAGLFETPAEEVAREERNARTPRPDAAKVGQSEPTPLEIADPAPAWAPPPETPVEPARGTPAELLREMMAEQRRAIAQARSEGNSQAVAKLMRDLANTTKDLATAEKDAAKAGHGADAVVFSKAELEAADAELDAYFATLAAHPLQCSSCRRAMRIRIASDGEIDS